MRGDQARALLLLPALPLAPPPPLPPNAEITPSSSPLPRFHESWLRNAETPELVATKNLLIRQREMENADAIAAREAVSGGGGWFCVLLMLMLMLLLLYHDDVGSGNFKLRSVYGTERLSVCLLWGITCTLWYINKYCLLPLFDLLVQHVREYDEAQKNNTSRIQVRFSYDFLQLIFWLQLLMPMNDDISTFFN